MERWVGVEPGDSDNTRSRSMFNNTDTGSSSILANSEYVEICYLFLFVAIGVPINVFTLARVGRQYYVTKSRILLLNVNLNISDLMILLFYAFADAVWFATEQWLGGVVLCKLLKFFQLFSFCLSSNVIICIGVDRLWSLLAPLHVKAAANRRCRRMVAGAWILAAASSTPQLYLWNVRVDIHADNVQCVNTYGLPIHNNESDNFAQQAINTAILYDIYHLLITFWIPCILVVICYVIILTRVMKHLGDDSQVEFVQTKTCDCSSGASAQGRPFAESSLNRFQSRRDIQCDRVSTIGLVSVSRKCHTCETYCGPSAVVKTGINLHQNGLRRSGGQMRIRRTKYRTLKVTMFIVAAYIICWLPYNFLAIWTLIYPELDISLSLQNFLCGLIALNALVNPLIYGRLTLALYWRGGVGGLRRRSAANKRMERRDIRFT